MKMESAFKVHVRTTEKLLFRSQVGGHSAFVLLPSGSEVPAQTKQRKQCVKALNYLSHSLVCSITAK